MEEKKLTGFYVNGNNQMGMGHISRVLEIAGEYQEGVDILFDRNQTDEGLFGNTRHAVFGVESEEELLSLCRKKQYRVFVNDSLDTGAEYMLRLRQALPNARLINFEDEGSGIRYADAVVNALYGEDLPGRKIMHAYYGEKYYVASRAFLSHKPIPIRPKVETVFICFGGADPADFSGRLLRLVEGEEYRDYRFLFALGRAKGDVEELMKYNQCPNIQVLYDVSDMPSLMEQGDVAVTSRGRTSYELATLGIPTLAMAQNERETRHDFVCDENGFRYLGLRPTDAVLASELKRLLTLSAEERSMMQEKLLNHDLRKGRERVMEILRG